MITKNLEKANKDLIESTIKGFFTEPCVNGSCDCCRAIVILRQTYLESLNNLVITLPFGNFSILTLIAMGFALGLKYESATKDIKELEELFKSSKEPPTKCQH